MTSVIPLQLLIEYLVITVTGLPSIEDNTDTVPTASLEQPITSAWSS